MDDPIARLAEIKQLHPHPAHVLMGVIDHETSYYATREMALDAGDPALEGCPVSGPTQSEEVWEDHEVYLKDQYNELETIATTLAQEVVRLREVVRLTVETYDAHDTETRSCDRDGNDYCDCLDKRIEEMRAALTPKDESNG